ncbi:MAG: preprotein translocase subunit YajC [Planctomycetota bacterium]|jgi:preprotein translocase subunit YajC
MNNVWILAQPEPDQAPSRITSEPVNSQSEAMETVPSDPNAPAGIPQRRGLFGSYGNLIFLGLMFAVMYMILFRGPRIGGIIGTVVDIKGDEVTLKVDESNNTKIRIAASAIGRNMSKDKS